MHYLKILLFFLTGIHYAFLTDETTTVAPVDSNPAPPPSDANDAKTAEYVAGVLECDSVSGASEVFAANYEKYKTFVTKAADANCKILVFPEVNLAGSIGLRMTDQPEKPENCDSTNEDSTNITSLKAMQALSCLAKEKKMYLVFESLAEECTTKKPCPKNEMFFVYNSKGVRNPKFAKTGPKIIDTDFGVKFMVVSDKDFYLKDVTKMLLEKKITNVISTVTNLNNAPLFTAIALQAGWAYVYNINLLASGFGYGSKPDAFGSGIYMGKKGPIATFKTNKEETCKLLTATVKENPDPWVPDTVIPEPRVNKTDLKNFKQESINATADKVDKKLCHKDLCCNFKIEFTKTGGRKKRDDPPAETTTAGGEAKPDDKKGIHYRLLVYSGKLMSVEIEVCSVIACTNEDFNTCNDLDATAVARSVDSIMIDGTFTPYSFVVPMVFNRYYLPLQVNSFEYKPEDKNKITLKSKSAIADFSSFGILGQTKKATLGLNSGANDLKLMSMRQQRHTAVWGKFLYRAQIMVVFLISTFIFH